MPWLVSSGSRRGMFDDTLVVIVIVVEPAFVTVDFLKRFAPILEATSSTHEPEQISRGFDGNF